MTASFYDTYPEARAAFIAAAHQNAYSLHTYRFADHRAANGTALACDVAMRKGRDRSTLVITTSGVHGVEGHAGSALQRNWMEGQERNLPFDTIHVHALNPYGFDRNHRTDAENIDVNRNFVPRFPVVGVNPRYRDFADVFVPKRVSPLSYVTLYATLARYGLRTMQDVLTQGQYDFPKGMFYGGMGKSWSRRTFEDIIATYTGGYARIVHLDLHTGLGKLPGALQVIYPGKRGDAAYDFAKSVWPEDQIGVMSDQENNSVSSTLNGDTANAWRLNGASQSQTVSSFTFEFATQKPLKVFFALQADHSARAFQKDSRATQTAYEKMRMAFAPQDLAWECGVLANGNNAYAALIHSLS